MLEQVLENHPKMDGIRPILATCLAAQGKRDEALAQLTDKVKEIAAADHDIAYWLGSAYALLGEEQEALQWLEAAIRLGNENYLWFQSDPNWTSIRSNPRYQRLLEQVGTRFKSRQAHSAEAQQERRLNR